MDDNDLSKKKNLVKEKIQEYIKEYYKRLQTPGTPTQSINMYKFKNLEKLVSRLYSQDKIKVSKSTVQLALSELKATIEKRDGFYQYTEEAIRANAHFPILKFAKDIEIVNLKPRQFAFFRVFPNVASEIVNYLNTVIIDYEIYSVAIGDIIMCIDVGYEEDNEYSQQEKGEDFEEHIKRILQDGKFNLLNYTYVSDKENSVEPIESESQEYVSSLTSNSSTDKEEREIYDNILEEMETLVEKYVIKYLTEYFESIKKNEL